MDALVTDVNLRYAVAGLRGLARSGLEVAALAPRRTAAGLWSRYPAAREVGPDAEHEPEAFAHRVGEIARARGPLMVYPCHERSIDALFDASLPPDARLPYPGREPLRKLRDKRSLGALAPGAGLASPGVLAEGTAGEMRANPPPTPCVVKPVGAPGALVSAQVAPTAAALDALLARLPEGERLLAQECLGGSLVGLALVVDREGGVAARFQQKALRTWPPDAGGSSLAVGVEPDDELVERVVTLLRAAGYWGLAHLQFLGGRDGPVLIDVNPRFYGSLPLAIASGVDLAAAWHAVATGAKPPRPSRYRVGVTYRWLEGDVTAAWNGDRRRLLRRAPRPRVGAMWSAEDPAPSTILAAEATWARVSKRLPGARRR